MTAELIFGMLIPFFGTTLGASCVLFTRKKKQSAGVTEVPEAAGERLQKHYLFILCNGLWRPCIYPDHRGMSQGRMYQSLRLDKVYA